MKKLLDKAFESCLEESELFGEAVIEITRLSAQVAELTRLVETMAKAIQIHQQALIELSNGQGMIAQSMQEGSLDTRMPECTQNKCDKPN